MRAGAPPARPNQSSLFRHGEADAPEAMRVVAARKPTERRPKLTSSVALKTGVLG